MNYWRDACSTSTFLINTLPANALKNKSSIQKLVQKDFDFTLLKVFGCQCFSFIHPISFEICSFSLNVVSFFGYSPIHKQNKCKSMKTGKLYISLNIIFNKNTYIINKFLTVAGVQYLIILIQLLIIFLCLFLHLYLSVLQILTKGSSTRLIISHLVQLQNKSDETDFVSTSHTQSAPQFITQSQPTLSSHFSLSIHIHNFQLNQCNDIFQINSQVYELTSNKVDFF